ncbi:hypothetical protein M3E13_09460 [Oceanobacillus kimchii]|uniref:hypothetical protein n=1 Tax=Oceanobacillus kimchii TaxID=746691 RepID=UPI00034895D3|nr:hypothetical protein [Oceanobacillus kimchii]MCT1576509.1 hypothetical protein [Oceanobacillus kimchii]MCT2136145.1 hypothetical protein [Oceanobacillus kimchii]
MNEKISMKEKVIKYVVMNLPSFFLHFLILIIASFTMDLSFETSQAAQTLVILMVLYVLGGVVLKVQPTMLHNLLSVSLILIYNIVLYLGPILITSLEQSAWNVWLIMNSIPFIYLAFLHEQLILVAIIIPSTFLMIGLSLKTIFVRKRKKN